MTRPEGYSATGCPWHYRNPLDAAEWAEEAARSGRVVWLYETGRGESRLLACWLGRERVA